MFIPDLQLRGGLLARRFLGLAENSGQSDVRVGLMIGAILGGYSLAQLIAAPWLGRMSDRIGRRRILIVTTAISLVSYVLYAHAEHYGIVMLARVLSGFAAANLGVAFAYVADVTAPQDRAKAFGSLGAALGLGFILGPPLGGWLIARANDSPLLLGYTGAALVVLNLVYIVLLLPEPEVHRADRLPFLKELGVAFRTPGLALLLAMFFAFNLAFANLQSTFFLLLADSRSVFHLSETGAKENGSYILGLVGVVGALMQGVIVPQLTGRFGEMRMLRIGFFLAAPALALVPFAPLWIPTILVVVAMGVGNGLSQPPLNALVSRMAPRELQGGVFGVTQALGALARLIGPVISNPLFAAKPFYPYLLGGAIMLFPAFAALRVAVPKPEEAAEAGTSTR
jgi:MFS family permease